MSSAPAPCATVLAPPDHGDGLATLLLRARRERSALMPSAGINSALLQRYEQLTPHVGGGALQGGNYRVVSGLPEFEAQQVTAGPKAISAAVAPPANPPLRVSEDGRIAIEETDLTHRQPKVFYATASVVQASNQALTAVNSDYELYADRPQAIRVRTAAGTRRTLGRILPRTVAVPVGGRTAGQQGLTMDIGADCIMVAKAVMKHADQSRMPQLGIAAMNTANVDYSDFKTARAMAAWVKTEKRRTTGNAKYFWRWFATADQAAISTFGKSVMSGPGLDQALVQTLAASYAYVQLNEPALAAQAAQRLGLNVHASPEVGEAYETYRISLDMTPTTRQVLGQRERDFWAQHIGGVVAKSAGNTVTLENYHRGHDLPANVNPVGAHYYFQMYGPANLPHQTWHAAWTAPTAAGAPVGLPADLGMDAMTAVVRHA